MLVTMLGIAGLTIVAVFDKSVVMFVSVAAIAIIVYLFRRARMRDKVIGIIAAGLGGSIGGAIVLTFYQHAGVVGAGAAGDSGGFFMSAILVGAINAATIIVVILTTEVALRIIGRNSE